MSSSGNPDAIRRFRREAHTLARLNHPNICTIYEIEDHDGKPFIAMERLEGTNLKTHIARKTLETREVLEIAAQIAEALDAAHGAGIVHRDIKPGNIFVGPNGQVKVLDFGMARSFSRDEGTAPRDGSTIPGRPIGTVNYMAPERILQMPLDARCDLFSLGVVMYEMATGRLPFAGASPSETVTNILENQPTPLTKLSPERPGATGSDRWPADGKARRRAIRNGARPSRRSRRPHRETARRSTQKILRSAVSRSIDTLS